MGTPQTGPAILEAQGGLASRVEYDLPSGTRIELRGEDAHGVPWGAWIDGQGAAHPMALHNSWSPATWFLPRLSVLALAHPDEELAQLPTSGGQLQIQHDRLLSNQPPDIQAEIKRLSTAVLSLQANYAPVSLRYALHPDQDAGRDISTEVRFSDFQRVDGVLLPFHVQQFMQGALDYDIHVQNAEINPSLPSSDFAEPPGLAAARSPRHRGVQ